MALDQNIIPEKIVNFNVYTKGDKHIGMGEEMELPSIKMKSSTLAGAGIGGEIDSPTMGQLESMEQELKYNALYSTATTLMKPNEEVEITLRGAQQVRTRSGGFSYKSMRVVMRGMVKEVNLGTVKKGEPTGTSVKLELHAIKVEVDGVTVYVVDKLNEKFVVNGEDMMAPILAMC